MQSHAKQSSSDSKENTSGWNTIDGFDLAAWQNVPGWFNEWGLVQGVSDAQKESGITGHLGEIGVFCGRSLACLVCQREESELVIGIDCFADQSLNVSRSGWRPGFNSQIVADSYLREIGCDDQYTLIAGTSDVARIMCGFRIWHIDGGHSYAETMADLTITAKTLVPGGVLIVDDYGHENWPDVQRATDDFCAASDYTISVRGRLGLLRGR